MASPFEYSENVPQQINYSERVSTGIRPGSLVYEKYKHTYGATAPHSPCPNFIYDVPPNKVVRGNLCFLKIRAFAQKSDGTNVLRTDAIDLAAEADNVLIDSINMKLNGTPVPSNCSSEAYVGRSIYERVKASTNAQRLGGEFKHRRVNRDDELEVVDLSQTSGRDRHFTKIVIQNGKTFCMIRPLDDLAFMGPDDGALPPTTNLSFEFRVMQDLSRLFRTAPSINNSPRLIIKEIELNIALEAITPEVNSLLVSALVSDGLPFSTTVRRLTNLNTIEMGSAGFSSVNQLNISPPDLMMVFAMPQSTFNPNGDGWKTKSILTRTFDKMDEVRISVGGNCVRDFRNISEDGKNVFLQELNSVRGSGAHLDSTIFERDAGTGAVIVGLHHEDRTAHDQLLEQRYAIDVRMTPAGATENLTFFTYTETKEPWLIRANSITRRI